MTRKQILELKKKKAEKFGGVGFIGRLKKAATANKKRKII